MNQLVKVLKYIFRRLRILTFLSRGANSNTLMDERSVNFLKILDEGHGNKKSFDLKKSVDSFGDPIPWFTYPSIEYLKQLDFGSLELLEWGLGNSTLFFSKRCSKIFSIEHNKDWFDLISPRLQANAKAFLVEESNYVDFALDLNQRFDVIIVDGIRRLDCLKASVEMLNEGGMIVFDNSDRNPDFCELIRSKDFIQVDFHGFGPIVNFTTTTSIFYSRAFDIKPLSKQPVVPIGGGF